MFRISELIFRKDNLKLFPMNLQGIGDWVEELTVYEKDI